jgi:prophage antirepressor-like protein
MNELQIFNYESNEVRTVMWNGEPWFCLVDVCRVLGIKNPSQMADRLDQDERAMFDIGRQGKTWFINESGLYSVILRSDKPKAKPFRKWVTGTVLPSIRKTGAYSAGKTLPDSSAKSALAEAKLNNSRARLASVWLKIANTNPVPEYKQICTHYASAVLAGREVLPLPEAAERTYSAEEVGELLGGVSANMVGRVANQNGLKTPEYGIQVWDKSRHSAKQVPSWRYNDRAVERLREILKA